MTPQHPIKVVVTKSNGGTFDDDAFVAGYTIGVLHAQFRQRKSVSPIILAEGALPQVDLLAMAYGYAVSSVPIKKGWVAVTCEPLAAVEEITPENAIMPPLAPPA